MDPWGAASNRRIRKRQGSLAGELVGEVLVVVIIFLIGTLLWVHFIGFRPP